MSPEFVFQNLSKGNKYLRDHEESVNYRLRRLYIKLTVDTQKLFSKKLISSTNISNLLFEKKNIK